MVLVHLTDYKHYQHTTHPPKGCDENSCVGEKHTQIAQLKFPRWQYFPHTPGQGLHLTLFSDTFVFSNTTANAVATWIFETCTKKHTIEHMNKLTWSGYLAAPKWWKVTNGWKYQHSKHFSWKGSIIYLVTCIGGSFYSHHKVGGLQRLVLNTFCGTNSGEIEVQIGVHHPVYQVPIDIVQWSACSSVEEVTNCVLNCDFSAGSLHLHLFLQSWRPWKHYQEPSPVSPHSCSRIALHSEVMLPL